MKLYPIMKVKNNKTVGETGYGDGEFVIAFVYSNKGAFLLKGFQKEVREWLEYEKTNHLRYIVNYTGWKHKIQIFNNWEFWHKDFLIKTPGDKVYNKFTSKWQYNKRWVIRPRVNHTININLTVSNKFKLSLRRLSKKWIPEYDNIINNFNIFLPKEEKHL